MKDNLHNQTIGIFCGIDDNIACQNEMKVQAVVMCHVLLYLCVCVCATMRHRTSTTTKGNLFFCLFVCWFVFELLTLVTMIPFFSFSSLRIWIHIGYIGYRHICLFACLFDLIRLGVYFFFHPAWRAGICNNEQIEKFQFYFCRELKANKVLINIIYDNIYTWKKGKFIL